MAEETITSTTTEAWTGSDPTRATVGAHMLLEPGMEFVIDPFTVGGLLELRSGGPPMTVRVVMGDTVHVEWFLDGKPHFASFPRQMLQAADVDRRGQELDRLIDDMHRQWLRLTAEPSPSQPIIPTLVMGFLGGFLTAALFGWLQ